MGVRCAEVVTAGGALQGFDLRQQPLSGGDVGGWSLLSLPPISVYVRVDGLRLIAGVEFGVMAVRMRSVRGVRVGGVGRVGGIGDGDGRLRRLRRLEGVGVRAAVLTDSGSARTRTGGRVAAQVTS